MRNRYEAICYRCGEPVAAGEGEMSFTRHTHRQEWPIAAPLMPFAIVEHVACAEKYAGTYVHHKYNPSKENNG